MRNPSSRKDPDAQPRNDCSGLRARRQLAPAPAALAGEPPTCNGKAATIVGGPGDYVIGTDGDDVIVSTDASHVVAGDGDDTVCVLGSELSLQVSVDVGDDYVDARAYSGERIR